MEVIKEADESSNVSSNIKSADMDDDEKPIEDYMRFVKFCMKAMAMIPMFEFNDQKYFQCANVFYILFVDFISVYIFSFSAADLIFSWDGNLFKATLNLINTIIYATNTLLLFYFQVKKSIICIFHITFI